MLTSECMTPPAIPEYTSRKILESEDSNREVAEYYKTYGLDYYLVMDEPSPSRDLVTLKEICSTYGYSLVVLGACGLIEYWTLYYPLSDGHHARCLAHWSSTDISERAASVRDKFIDVMFRIGCYA